MKSTSLLLLCLLLTSATQAQINLLKYFTDSVSIAFETSYVRKEKKKEVTVWIPRHYRVKTDGLSFAIYETVEKSKGNPMNYDMIFEYHGEVANIDFSKSLIQPYRDNGVNIATQPAGIHELVLYAGLFKPQFSQEDKLTGADPVSSVTLYFNSYDDAKKANDYLQRITIVR
ncbi:MAG: hypothetical protein AB7P01_04565 [Bacteroidia bacterium]